jgi:phospholipase C
MQIQVNYQVKKKSLHEKAFTTNKKDPDFHELTKLKYKDGDTEH